MNCKEFADFLIDYIDGNLPEQEAAAFDDHLRLCPPCVHYLESYKRCIELGKTCVECKEEIADVPEGLISAILSARKQC